jgi:hypothetical protein
MNHWFAKNIYRKTNMHLISLIHPRGSEKNRNNEMSTIIVDTVCVPDHEKPGS